MSVYVDQYCHLFLINTAAILVYSINVHSSTDPPVIPSVSVDPPGEVVEGSKVTLTCSSDANPPVDIYTWYRDITYVSTGPQLVKDNVSHEDSGQYVCQGTNRHGSQRSPPVSLDVQCKWNKLLRFLFSNTTALYVEACLVVVS